MTAHGSAPARAVFRFPLPRRPHGAPAAWVLGERTLVMGIVNVTPDSFSDGGRHDATPAAVEHALRLAAEGADVIDVGGESTRPGAAEVPVREQVRRVVPVIAALTAAAPDVVVSVDTRSADVARESVAAGAAVVNDVSGLAHDPAMRRTVAELGVPAVVMHMRGTPADMRERAVYDDAVEDVLRELSERLDAARAAGCTSLLADPGLGFAKSAGQSASLLRALPRFAALGVPVLVGPSRKSFLASAVRASPDTPPDAARRSASIAAAALAAWLGAHVVRVHDVAACADAVRMADLVRDGR